MAFDLDNYNVLLVTEFNVDIFLVILVASFISYKSQVVKYHIRCFTISVPNGVTQRTLQVRLHSLAKEFSHELKFIDELKANHLNLCPMVFFL